MENQIENILAYLENRMSKLERKEFEQQLLSSEDLRKQLSEIRFINDATSILNESNNINVDQRWKRVSARINKNKYIQTIGIIIRWSAAVVALPLLVSSIYFYKKSLKLENLPTELVEQTAAYGLISKIKLPDNSEIWLNSGSTIHYPKRFTMDNRQVYLSGEAYFKVSSDKNHRFDVKLSNGLMVSAYGTEFNVNSYQEDDNIKIDLSEGAVEVRNEMYPLPRILSPGQQAEFDKQSKLIQVTESNLYQTTSWKDGKMVFRRTPMSEVGKRLSRHFNVDITLQNKEIFDYKYSATFTTETLEEILILLEKTAPIRCKMIHPAINLDLSYTKKRVLIESR